jgi:hypothetical protein
MLLTLLYKIEGDEMLPNSFHEASIVTKKIALINTKFLQLAGTEFKQDAKGVVKIMVIFIWKEI